MGSTTLCTRLEARLSRARDAEKKHKNAEFLELKSGDQKEITHLRKRVGEMQYQTDGPRTRDPRCIVRVFRKAYV